ncbi:3-isopropylmalate dehydratase small subunit [Chloroflexus aggregans]|uniref:3-isopropylmalate dehydratase small subunit n=1 Tax=Chloroflexus aggregans (strain MD-66 / DSM 9485) TaxID=326427 RepID=LEUD_CHLAD|nr:3-isopropylmalate dehydratase small subunit [Chloroflexus aggregans]B8G7X5.1 RecName: Full=3-isopropylmalate dehydratase small subunit; AltName: Full=Alpha-IPM isomerase; Short=IPMI; AltName: Full=Isopropylmalate isomerase [Chloroflexus aggregans DSM 9485]ACL24154.1 3-isopropylmalate dehydratase, small subunit [Chloroflexus aggregans DSM 9485]
MEPISTITGKVVVLPVENIDTDQIIPARFLKVTDKSGLAAGLFEAWRYLPDGTLNPDFPLNRPEAAGATILISGRNFGCGSSREHAPWALQDYGFQAVIAPSFADIFRNNALKIGLLPVMVEQSVYDELVVMYANDPSMVLTIDLAAQIVALPDGRQVHFPIDAFSKYCLLHGVDQLGFLLQQEAAIAAYEAAHPQPVQTTVRR